MKRLTRIDRSIAWLIFAVVLATLLVAGRTQGNTRDEGYYFNAAELYYGWYAELADGLPPLRSVCEWPSR